MNSSRKVFILCVLVFYHFHNYSLAKPALDPEPEEELYYVIQDDNKTTLGDRGEGEATGIHNSKIKKFFKQQAQQLIDQNLDAAGNVISKGIVSLGLKLSVKKVPYNTIVTDTDKFYSDTGAAPPYTKQWYKYGFTVSPMFGSSQFLLLFDNLKFPLNLDPGIGARVGKSNEYSIISPRNIKEFADAKTVTKVAKHITGIVQAYKFSMPDKAKHLLNIKKYPSGTELTWRRQNFGLFALGLNVPVSVATVGARQYMMLEGILNKKMKVFREQGKTFVEVEITNEKTNSKETSFEASFGVNIFESAITNGTAAIRVLSASKKKVRTKELKISYVFDLSYPDSAKALDEVFKNNFVQAQSLATDLTQFHFFPNTYKGVLLTENHSQELISNIASLHYGLFSNRFRIQGKSLTLSLNNIIPDIFISSHEKATTTTQGTYQYPYENPISRYSLTLNKDHKMKILGGLWANKSSRTLYNNELVNSLSLNGIQSSYNQILLQERVENENESKTGFEKFYEPSRYVFKLLKPNLSSLLNVVEQNNKCYEDYKMTKHLILYPDVIDEILKTSREQHYRAFAKIFNSPYQSWWLDAKIRNKRLSQHFNKFFKESEAMTNPMTKYIKKMYKLFLKIEKLNIYTESDNKNTLSLETFKKEFNNINLPKESEYTQATITAALSFHKKYSEVVLTPGFIDYLTILSAGTTSQSFFSGFVLKSKSCDVQWINSPQDSVNPETISKEIDKYIDDFWN